MSNVGIVFALCAIAFALLLGQSPREYGNARIVLSVTVAMMCIVAILVST